MKQLSVSKRLVRYRCSGPICHHIVVAADQAHPTELVGTSLSRPLWQISKIFPEQTLGITSRMVGKVEFPKTSGCNESKVVDEGLRNNFFSRYLLLLPPPSPHLPPSPVRAPFLITRQPCRADIPPAYLRRLPAPCSLPPSLLTLWCELPTNLHTWGAPEPCDRELPLLLRRPTSDEFARPKNSRSLRH